MNFLYRLLLVKTLFWSFSKFSKGSLAVVCLFFLGSIITAQAVVWNKDVTEEEVLEMARPMTSVVEIEVIGGQGSGVLLPTGKHVLTAKHVVMNAIWGFLGYEVVSEKMYVIVEDAAGRRTSMMAKRVYLHPSEADIAIIELPHPVAQLLDEDEGNPSIVPSPLYREDPQNLCGELLHGAGYGRRGMEMDEASEASNGNRYYYETFFKFVLDTPCLPDSSDDLSRLGLDIESLITLIERMEEDLKSDRSAVGWGLRESGVSDEEALLDDLSWIRAIIDSVANLDGIPFLRKWLLHRLANARSSLKVLLGAAFEIKVDKKMRDEATFIGGVLPGDSGSPLFDKENRVVAVITTGTEVYGNLLRHSSMGELVYPFLGWIDDVMAGRRGDMLSVNSNEYIVVVETAMALLPQSFLSYALDSLLSRSPQAWCLAYVMVYAYCIDDTGLVELMVEGFVQEGLFAKLAEGSYLWAAIQVLGMYLRGY